MAYERQYYTNGDVLDARQMNHMETGIKENSDNIDKLSEEIDNLKENEIINIIYNIEEFGALNNASGEINNSVINITYKGNGYAFIGGATNYILNANRTYRMVYLAESFETGYSTPVVVGIRNGVWSTGDLFFGDMSKNTTYVKDITPSNDISIGLRWDDTTEKTFKITLLIYDITELQDNELNLIDFTNVIDFYSIPKAIKTISAEKIITWYKDKEITSFGDSVTEQNKWQNYVIQKLMIAKHNNCGVAGSRVGGTLDWNSAAKNSMWQDTRINSLPTTSDVIIFMGGLNDCLDWREIGSVTLDNVDCSTFAGALNVAISKIYYRFYKMENGIYNVVDYSNVIQNDSMKEIKIFLASPPYNSNVTYSGENAMRLKDYANAVKTIAELWHIPYIPIFESCGINKANSSIYLSDTIHPSEYGGKNIASVVIGIMKKHEPI